MAKSKNKVQVPTTQTITANVEIDYDKLAEAIVKAEEVAKEKADSLQKEKSVALRKQFGYDESKPLSLPLANIKMLLFANRKDLTGNSVGYGLLQSATESLLILGEFLLYLVCVSLLYVIFIQNNGQEASLAVKIVTFVITFVPSLFVARALRLFRFEIDNMQDRDCLNAIIGSLMAIVGTFVALFELFGSK